MTGPGRDDLRDTLAAAVRAYIAPPKPAASGMTYRDLVRSIVPGDLTDDECDFILWERTPFPLVMRPSRLKPYLERVADWVVLMDPR